MVNGGTQDQPTTDPDVTDVHAKNEASVMCVPLSSQLDAFIKRVRCIRPWTEPWWQCTCLFCATAASRMAYTLIIPCYMSARKDRGRMKSEEAGMDLYLHVEPLLGNPLDCSLPSLLPKRHNDVRVLGLICIPMPGRSTMVRAARLRILDRRLIWEIYQP